MTSDYPRTTERRQTPRYEVKMTIDLVMDGGNILTVTSRNISSCGMQIYCDSWVCDEIEPRGIQNHAISHLRFKAVAILPVAGENKKMYANCKILSVQRMSQEEYMLNLHFIDFENGTESTLDAFLDEHQQKKTVINVSG